MVLVVVSYKGALLLFVAHEVLALAIGLAAELYGVRWAMMIAGKAGHTVAVVFPLRYLSFSTVDVIHWTNRCTAPALYTTLFLDLETAVADQVFME